MDSAVPKRYCDVMKKILPDFPAEEILRSAGRTIQTERTGLDALAAALETGFPNRLCVQWKRLVRFPAG
jgi:arabinose-5-phosphate isomerase